METEKTQVAETIGKYRIQGELARGGMGIVYRAVHPQLKRQVVIKKLSIRGNAQILERFKREAQILLDLQHPNIVHMYDYFTEGSYHYIALEYVDGMSLDKLIKKQGHLSPQTSMYIFREACRALLFAHEHGVVHRDIKPGNILMSRNGDIKLADFGIASIERDGEDDDSLTSAGVALGTPSYMPPEQFSESRAVDNRADIYSMGVMLYEMVTGKKPYPGKLTPETLTLIQKGAYEAPERVNSAIDREVCALIKKMLQVKPKKRFQDVGALLKKVEKYLSRYDTDDIKTHLAQNIMTVKGPYEEPRFVEKNHILRMVTRAVRVAVIVVAAGTLLWKSGAVHRTILSPWYTPVQLAIELPPTALENADLPVRGFFFENDNATIPELVNCRVVFREKTAGDVAKELWDKSAGRLFSGAADGGGQGGGDSLMTDSSGHPLYHTKPVYLRPGEYRVKVVTGGYIWWQSLTVGKEPLVLRLSFLQNEKRNLLVHALAYDHDTMQPVPDARFKVLQGGSYVPLESVEPGKLQSGGVVKVAAEAPGYTGEQFSLRIEWYQDALYLNALLRREE